MVNLTQFEARRSNVAKIHLKYETKQNSTWYVLERLFVPLKYRQKCKWRQQLNNFLNVLGLFWESNWNHFCSCVPEWKRLANRLTARQKDFYSTSCSQLKRPTIHQTTETKGLHNRAKSYELCLSFIICCSSLFLELQATFCSMNQTLLYENLVLCYS